MARNAHPEVTRTRILDAAQRLFMAQGYEHTSIQNIVDRKSTRLNSSHRL